MLVNPLNDKQSSNTSPQDFLIDLQVNRKSRKQLKLSKQKSLIRKAFKLLLILEEVDD